MKRVMCLDYGDKNIGVAVSDSLRITAQALTVIRRDNESAIKAVLQKLTELITKYDIGEIVLGYPRNMNGSEGFRCEKTREFKIRLEKRFVTPVILWDERLSTAGADRSLMHLTKEKRKNIIDKMAAVFILQGYLDNQNALNTILSICAGITGYYNLTTAVAIEINLQYYNTSTGKWVNSGYYYEEFYDWWGTTGASWYVQTGYSYRAQINYYGYYYWLCDLLGDV